MFAPSRTDPDLTPLPIWRQKVARFKDQWRRSKDRRKVVYSTLVSAGTAMLSLVFAVAGATLIAYGVYEVYRPAGFVTGGIMCWVLQWSRERDRGRTG